MKQFVGRTKEALKPGKIAKGVALTVLQPAYDIVEDIPVPGAKAGIGALLDLIKGIDVSIAQPIVSERNPPPSSLYITPYRRLPGTLRPLQS